MSEYDYLYKMTGWRGGLCDSNTCNIPYQELSKQVNESVLNLNIREFFISIQSKLADGRDLHVPLFDFDFNLSNGNMTVEEAFESVHRTINFYLPDGAFIYSTLNGFHVIGSYLLPTKEYMLLLDMVGCCSGFKSVAHSYGFSSLRIGCKELRYPDITFKGFYAFNEKRILSGINVDPVILDFLNVKATLEEKMRRLYVYRDGCAIFPKYKDLDLTKGFALDDNGDVLPRFVDVSKYAYEYCKTYQ